VKITVNGQEQETQASTLAQLCRDLGYGDAKIATAVNGEFVPVAARRETVLREHDKVEIVSPRQGG
jgi:sulfur carrier protein